MKYTTRKRIDICVTTVLVSLFIFITGCGTGETSKIKVGLGETIITPGENVQMRGFARSQVSTGVHDDLHARSLVIEGGDGTVVVMMTISLVTLSEEYGKRIRSGINEKTGIPENNIAISCTHTHAGPNIQRAGESYQKFLVDRSIVSAVEAWQSRVPGRIGIGSTVVMELGRNRRRLLYDGLQPRG
ncbi:neutral/alkaline non-lysosomal ceramidase N-terminal domain-containing protein [candidate division KSB1 bacterium]